MQQEQQRPPPPSYAQHEAGSLHLPSVPTHPLPPPTQHHHIHNHNNDRLPGIRSLDLPDASPARIATTHNLRHEVELSPKSTGDALQWGALPPISSASFPRVPEGLPRGSLEMDVGSPMDTASVISAQDDAGRRREMSVLSVDDPDVRLAAEALSGLGNPDFIRSPTSRSLTIPRESISAEQEPLLSLITSNHPWLGGTINGSISAYNTTKTYSPRLIKYGAELIERNIGSPVVNTVSSVGRRTGVEKNLRRYLGETHRRPSDLETGHAEAARAKRQRVMSPSDVDAMDIEDAHPHRTRGGSQSSYAETLPAYDDQRSPKYEETAVTLLADKETSTSSSSTQQDRRLPWSTQLIMTTSGLGVALSETSLRSLRLCLSLLRSATKHIDAVMHALQLVLEEYESALQNQSQNQSSTSHTYPQDEKHSGEEDPHVRAIASRMKSLSSDIWTTLQKVVQSVSRYTGGALPQNASQVVRTQLLSVPQRWQSAARVAEHGNGNGNGNGNSNGNAETGNANGHANGTANANGGGGEEVRGANRMLAFAKEGLDMMGQITAVVDGTVESAEGWLGRMGRGGNGTPGSEQQGRGREQQGQLEARGLDDGEKREYFVGGGGGGGDIVEKR